MAARLSPQICPPPLQARRTSLPEGMDDDDGGGGEGDRLESRLDGGERDFRSFEHLFSSKFLPAPNQLDA